MQDIYKYLKNLGGNFSAIFNNSRRKTNSVAFGVVSGAKVNLLSSFDNFVLCIMADSISALKLVEDLKLYGKKALYITSKEEVLVYNKTFSKDVTFERLSALYETVMGNADIAVITVESLIRRFPPADRFTEAIINIEVNKNYDLNVLIKRLVFAGYKRETAVESKGQFSLRGDILDIFPINSENPIRIDFFDNLAEKIKLFETDTGKSFDSLSSIDIAPATDIFIYDDEIPQLISKIKKSVQGLKLKPDYMQRINDITTDVISRLESGSREYSLNFILPFISGDSSFKQYLNENAVIAFDESKLLSDKTRLIYSEHDTRCENLLACGEILPESIFQYALQDELFSQFEDFSKISFNILNTKNSIFKEENVYNIKTSSVAKYSLNFEELCKDIRNWLFGGYKVILCCKSEDGVKELTENFLTVGLIVSEDIKENKKAVVLPLGIAEGFIYHEGKFVLIGFYDIWAKSRSRSIKRKKKDIFLTPEIGDYIVHEVHGIGKCKGIQKLDTGFTSKDYIVIEYRDGDVLYVPCDQMDLIAKYAGSDTLPKLNKLGGKEFEKIKQKVKNYIKEMAFDLKKLYAEREERVGFAFSPDSPMQKDFEDAFEYEETDDQIKSIAEIKKDMESPKVMDRLLCGDVGYGKTEVALRAAFKAVVDSKQTAMLAPTTILTQQHYNLCIKRFKGCGVRIDVLNRFKNPAEQAEIINRLKNGKIDIIIGTQRLLSKDIEFKDLGLLIVDEEQRFGVEDKEKIKNINSKVDVLTLTATPIPRTLHMSLSGIRDISVLDTPPRERLPVQTYVLEYSEGLVQDAISRELSRGGQVFILYNRVESIESFAYKITRLVPNAKVITAHGQMNEDNLESAIENFYNGSADVLICTTIIENGIDIPNTNTLIVYEADRLGLSQLYQLRGRVGRGNRLAHVYFTYIPEKVLTENAYKRLKAIMEFTEFGSGFKIAMRDLEIRGAGNVLGKQQHGHMENVGYDMYLRLLKQSVDEIGGNTGISEHIECDVLVDAYVPEKYVEDNNQRMKVYQRIAALEEISEKQEIIDELIDIYGVPPQPVINLIDISVLKILAGMINATGITIKPAEAGITLKDMNVLKNQGTIDAMEKFKEICILSFSDKPVIVFKTKNMQSVKILNNMINFCASASKL